MPTYFTVLRVMKLNNFPNLKHLYGLAELPCLEKLDLWRMPSLESISGGPFPSLVKLAMWDLPRLVILHETVHELHRKNLSGVIFKIDFEKAYDKVK